MQSYGILGALKSKLKATIEYFCQATHIGIEENVPFSEIIVLCLGQHSLFLLDETMQKLKGEVFYAHIKRLVEQKTSTETEDVIRIEMNEDRPTGIPAKVTLITTEKAIFLKHLKCYWETDYMWRVSKIGFLRIDQENIELKRFKPKKKDNKPKDKYTKCSTNSFKFNQQGYSYFCNAAFKPSRLLGEYTGTLENGENYMLKVIIEQSKLLENMRDDLKSKTESKAESLLNSNSLEPPNAFCYLKNCAYFKKMNLVLDLASWAGWEVLLKSGNIYFSIIILRRKFIPPLMDSGQDLIFCNIGGKASRELNTELADSIFTNQISSEYYKNIIEQRCHALIMDEESASFFQYNLQIKPNCISYAYSFIYGIIKIMSYESTKIEIQGLKVLKGELEKIMDASLMNDDPYEVIKKFMQESKASKGSNGYMKWCEKVCRYLAYALNGGFFQRRLTLEIIIEEIMKGSLRKVKDLMILKICIKLLLHVKKITEPCDESEDLSGPISKLINECGNRKHDIRKWIFNEKIMICLIESSYLQRELDISGNVNTYPDLLLYMLESPWSSYELKCAICRVTTSIDEPNEYGIFKALIPYYIDIFCGKNYTLASQAAISLINLTFGNRQNKQTLFKQLDRIVARLNTKDQKLLSYTLQLLTNLGTEASRKKVIGTVIRDSLMKIITGKVIDKDYMSSEVLSKTINLMITVSKDHSTLDYFFHQDSLNDILLEYLNKGDDIISKIAWFLELIAEKSNDIKKKLGEIYIEPLIKIISQNASVEAVKNILGLINSLIVVQSNFELVKQNNLFKVLKEIRTGSDIQGDNIALQLVSSLLKKEIY
jgi:hypothetical protein